MEKEDARYQKLGQLHERRKQVVRLHLRGIKVMQIVEMTGLSYPSVRKTIDLFVEDGWQAIRPAPRGRNLGDGRRLSREQELKIRDLICNKRPSDLGLTWALWTRTAVMDVIKSQLGISLSVRATGKYLRRWGFTPLKPGEMTADKRNEALRQWVKQHYPGIRQRAKLEGGEVHWGCQSTLMSNDLMVSQDICLEPTPAEKLGAGQSLLSTVTNQGRANWMIIDERLGRERLDEFLQALVSESKMRGKKVFLIVHDLGEHLRNVAQLWQGENLSNIEVFFLPLAHTLNPDLAVRGPEVAKFNYLGDQITQESKVPVINPADLYETPAQQL